jgi:pSer/pThr/pTyr-binding forkhead associated (FHA) protein
MKVKLKVVSGSMSGKEIRLKAGRFLIGRGKDCQLRAQSELVSRNHCEIEINKSAVIVRDLGSRNGTFVNDTKVEGDHSLEHSDELRVGPLKFHVVIEGKPEAKPRKRTAEPTVKHPEKPAASGPSAADLEEDDISQWLDEEPSDAAEGHGTDTVDTDETDRVEFIETQPISAAGPESKDTPNPSAPKGKQKPGKLPPVPEKKASSSREAAADILKSLSRRR